MPKFNIPIANIMPADPAHAPSVESSLPNTYSMWIRIGFLLIFVISSVLIIVSFLNYSNYRKNFLELNLSRYLVVARDLRQSVEAGLNVGLPPASNTHLRSTMLELKKQQSGTNFIAILDEMGNVFHDGKVPANISTDWKTRLINTESYWQTSHSDNLELGMPFRNNFNLKIGAIIIGYDRIAIENAMTNMRQKIILDTLQTILVASIFILIGVKLITRKLSKDLQIIKNVVDQVVSSANPPMVPENSIDPKVADDINIFANLSHRVIHLLKANSTGANVRSEK